jgi:hypothetical protein
LVLAAVSALVVFAIACWVSFSVLAIEPKGSGLRVERAVGSLDLDLREIDSLTL